jgi:hypothetical protein
MQYSSSTVPAVFCNICKITLFEWVGGVRNRTHVGFFMTEGEAVESAKNHGVTYHLQKPDGFLSREEAVDDSIRKGYIISEINAVSQDGVIWQEVGSDFRLVMLPIS